MRVAVAHHSLRLSGKRVLVTRPDHQAANLVRLITEAGGVAVKLPTLAIQACDNRQQINDAFARLDQYQWIVFISANAVNFALKAIGGKIAEVCAVRWAAIGQATADALVAAQLPVDLLPVGSHDTQALLATAPMQTVNGQRILIVNGEGGREELAEGLRANGAHVDTLPVYRRCISAADCTEVRSLLAANRLDAITITSGEALLNLLAMLTDKRQQLLPLPLFVVSDRIRQMAANLGFSKIAVADGPSDMAMLNAVLMIMGK